MEEKIQPVEQLKTQVIVVEEEKKLPEYPEQVIIDVAKLRALGCPVVPYTNGHGIIGDFALARPNMEIPVSV